MIPAVWPLLACWSEVTERLAASRLAALFLDFDGTLAAIQPRPELDHFPERLRAELP